MSAQVGPAAPHLTQAIFGHDHVVRRLLEIYRSGRQHHAVLLTGSVGIGKATLAFRLAGFLLEHPDPNAPSVRNATDLSLSPESRTARLMAGLAHPDLTVVTPWIFGEENKSGEIKVDHIRWALSKLSTVADGGGWRVCIIDSADDMNANAANALLKVLEEPPRRTIFILISHRPRRLLATIRSRCIALELETPSLDDARQALLAARPDLAGNAEIDPLIELAQSSPGAALKLADAGGLALHRRLTGIIDELPRLDLRTIHEIAGDLAPPKADDRFRLFMDMLIDELARISAQTARTQGGRHALEPWIELWEKGDARLFRDPDIQSGPKKTLS